MEYKIFTAEELLWETYSFIKSNKKIESLFFKVLETEDKDERMKLLFYLVQESRVEGEKWAINDLRQNMEALIMGTEDNNNE